MITEKQFKKLDKKYGKLLHSISHRISGDKAIAMHDDNMQDLWAQVLTTVEAFARLNKEAYPGGFPDFEDTVHFNKYLKTSMWHLKNSKGAKITKKFAITRNTVSIAEHDEVLQIPDPTIASPDTEIYLGELPHMLTEEQTNLVKLIVEDPKYIKPSGKANVNALAKELGKSWMEVSELLAAIGTRIKNHL